MNESLAGRTALVTGGGRGIGRAIAVELARSGAAVAVNYRRDAESAQTVVATILDGGGRAVAIQASVDDPVQLDALAIRAEQELGPVDLLVCNAGVASRGRSVVDTDPEEFERLMVTHTLSVARLVQRLVPTMRGRPRGDVIVISSTEVDHLRAGGAPYTMAKTALEALAFTLAKEEVAHGIRVNVVAPGLVVTDMGSRLVQATLGQEIAELDATQPLGHVTRPDDVASVVRFLAGPDAAHVTGQRIIVDGGAG